MSGRLIAQPKREDAGLPDNTLANSRLLLQAFENSEPGQASYLVGLTTIYRNNKYFSTPATVRQPGSKRSLEAYQRVTMRRTRPRGLYAPMPRFSNIEKPIVRSSGLSALSTVSSVRTGMRPKCSGSHVM
jgi:hypothetical protein